MPRAPGIQGLLLLAFGLALPAPSRGQSVDLVFDENCTTCSISAQTGVPFTLYVALRDWDGTRPAIGNGLAGIVLRITGLPDDWAVTWTPDPRASLATSPFDPVGGIVQFSPPILPPPCLVLYTCTITPGATRAFSLAADKHLHQNCDDWPGAIWGPRYTNCALEGSHAPKLCEFGCVSGHRAYLDGRPCAITAIQDGPWSALKLLYR